MCGICGELTYSGAPVHERALAAMTGTLAHRGPDHDAIYRTGAGNLGLGFRRLSIIDLRAAAHQPIGNEDGTIQLVFNGEIYNYRELRRPLAAKGHVFRSNSDSEVIVHLYEEYGEQAIDRLEGMFALALWDGRRQHLVLARDRVGKKPLFIWSNAERTVFASEIKALLVRPDLGIDIDEDAIPYYFLHGYVPHPATFYTNIRHIEPGTVVTIDAAGRRQTRRYWELSFPDADIQATTATSRETAARRVRELVTAAVRRRLMSDVPLGAFLSGGIDSTIVVGIMRQLANEPVRTFSIGFAGDRAFDETEVARQTAQRFGTLHTEFRVRPSAIELLDTLVYHHDGAFADSSAIPTYLVSKLTREHVTVALTGDGGDEVFGGYLRFHAALAAERMPAWAGDVVGSTFGRFPTPRNERHWVARGRRFARFMQLPLEDRVAAWAGVFYEDVEALLDPALIRRIEPIDRRRHLRGMPNASNPSPLSRILAANFHSYLHDDLLVKADRMSMAASLEARAPFLDRELVEYVAALPDEFKIRGRETKSILREAFADLLPEVVKRGPKKGFGVPLDTWFRDQLRELAHDTLLAPAARLRSFVDQTYVRRLLDEQSARQANHGHRLWTLLTFERWLQLLPCWRTTAGQ